MAKTIDNLKKKLLCNPKIKMMAFNFPQGINSTTSLSDILEDSVDDKYFLSDEYVAKLMDYNKRQKENNRGFSAKPRERNGISPALKIGGGMKDDLVYDN